MQSNSFIQDPPVFTVAKVRDLLTLLVEMRNFEGTEDRLNLSPNATAMFLWLLHDAIAALNDVIKALEAQGGYES